MPRPAFLIACLALLAAAAPAQAQTPLPCRVGPFAKAGHLVAEAADARVDARAGQVEYRLRVRNPYPWPAAVLAAIALPGVEEPAAEPVVIPPREARLVPAGAASAMRGEAALAVVPALRDAISVPFCVVPVPAAEAEAAPLLSGHPAVAAGGVQVIRDEGAYQVLQRF